ncbi:hypothetical protein M4I32_14420 [Microbacterium sp. LRZ72]|uniref:hypothetical protein n=1 Tax=Microbacterium sp. LRZ72 TaxID=2942481 RepID=UPI0029A06DFA|nr:hypothetical protein [Microbacterium sp. LRZ72]MDX2377989.1 hypothetical protein [Microbacterium sp. LRZ72]
MPTCDTCGNDYDKTFTLTRANPSGAETTGTFDSFECAISAMAPVCTHCGCRILGHGVENEQGIFCCAHCARQSGDAQLTDRA